MTPRRYIYDGEDILLEYDETSTLQARYTHGPGIDEPVAMTRGGSTFFYHQDGLGTVTELTDSAGTTAKAYAYDAWGNVIEQIGTVENPYTYTEREFDAETGLYDYRARAYDPRTGRFLRKDPLGLSGGDINLYVYAGNNPVRYTDPFGLSCCPRSSSQCLVTCGCYGLVCSCFEDTCGDSRFLGLFAISGRNCVILCGFRCDEFDRLTQKPQS